MLATQLHAVTPHLVKIVFARLLQFKVAIFSLPALLFGSESLSPPFRAGGGKRAGIKLCLLERGVSTCIIWNSSIRIPKGISPHLFIKSFINWLIVVH